MSGRMKFGDYGSASSNLDDFCALVAEGSKVLDAGCGTGRNYLELSRRGYDVTGTDVADEAVMAARRNAENEGQPVKIEHASMNALPFGDDVFDAIYSNAVPAKAFLSGGGSEVMRVLRRGGIAYIDMIQRVELLDPQQQENGWSYERQEIIEAFGDGFKFLRDNKDETRPETDDSGKRQNTTKLLLIMEKI